MANRFVLNETSYHGAGAILEIATEAKGRNFKKAFVCSDPDLIKFGVTKKVLDVLEKDGLSYEVYSNIKPNPTIENVQTGVESFKKSGADYIVAIGGGSSMDTAKAIGIIITNPEFADVKSLEGVAPTKNKCVPIFAVPTTAGTAAEVTINFSIHILSEGQLPDGSSTGASLHHIRSSPKHLPHWPESGTTHTLPASKVFSCLLLFTILHKLQS